MKQETIWAEKYRPKTVRETILPSSLKQTFQKFVDDGEIPQNLLLSGRTGVGKTTVAKAMLEEIGADYMVINGSLSGNIDTLRTDIMNFASTVSFTGTRKFVILDEADYLNVNSTQPALRNFMEEYSKNCGFILTCNFKNRIMEPLRGRCSVIEFNIPKNEKAEMAKQFFMRVMDILNKENVEYDKKVIAEVIQMYFPDWRRTLNELQRYSAVGKIDSGILANAVTDSIDELIKLLKAQNFTEVRKWVALNDDMDSSVLYRALYDVLPSKLSSAVNLAQCIIVLAEYEYKEAFVANTEINRAAAMASLMAEADWK